MVQARGGAGEVEAPGSPGEDVGRGGVGLRVVELGRQRNGSGEEGAGLLGRRRRDGHLQGEAAQAGREFGSMGRDGRRGGGRVGRGRGGYRGRRKVAHRDGEGAIIFGCAARVGQVQIGWEPLRGASAVGQRTRLLLPGRRPCCCWSSGAHGHLGPPVAFVGNIHHGDLIVFHGWCPQRLEVHAVKGVREGVVVWRRGKVVVGAVLRYRYRLRLSSSHGGLN